MKDFKNKVAVITGAANGIGRGIAKRAVKEGMKVVIADIEEKVLYEAEEELKTMGGTVLAVPTDVSKASNIEILAQRTIESFGEVNILFNNAGVGTLGFIWEYPLSDWKWMIDVNLWGVIHGIRVFVPIMLKQDNECHIVNTSSLAGLVMGNPANAIYTITKHGIVALSETLSRELELYNSKIKVSVLCPAYVNTTILDCERNRQPDYCDPDFEPTYEKFVKMYPDAEPNIDLFKKLVKQGLSLEKVGDIVFEAIKDDAFYILTHTSFMWRKAVKDRMDGILEAFKQNKAYKH